MGPSNTFWRAGIAKYRRNSNQELIIRLLLSLILAVMSLYARFFSNQLSIRSILLVIAFLSLASVLYHMIVIIRKFYTGE